MAKIKTQRKLGTLIVKVVPSPDLKSQPSACIPESVCGCMDLTEAIFSRLWHSQTARL